MLSDKFCEMFHQESSPASISFISLNLRERVTCYLLQIHQIFFFREACQATLVIINRRILKKKLMDNKIYGTFVHPHKLNSIFILVL